MWDARTPGSPEIKLQRTSWAHLTGQHSEPNVLNVRRGPRGRGAETLERCNCTRAHRQGDHGFSTIRCYRSYWPGPLSRCAEGATTSWCGLSARLPSYVRCLAPRLRTQPRAHSSLTRSSRSGLFAAPPAEVLPFQPVHRKLAAAERWSTIRVVLNTGASTSGPEAAAACHSRREFSEQACPRIGL
ncbi:hypothetical protein K466DRAFT_177375 [Polyporus arcularius HHB13444]|uniref:Uncharacterized protein n=1 Tax=Polyporus arcularius HHB13444 TaxID=1314778 RepID=A0A5C3P8H7_9APHY|nr:hypothetical protein K466DRAFT_177375 [Polyporus arcularius HHB13444]